MNSTCWQSRLVRQEKLQINTSWWKRANISNLHCSNSRVEIFRSWHDDSCLSFLQTLHTLSVLVWSSTLFFLRRVWQALSHVLLFLTFFTSSCSPAPRRVKMMPVWELRPTADTTILPDPSITWVPEERFKKARSHNWNLFFLLSLHY